jgi:hypothetical protein
LFIQLKNIFSKFLIKKKKQYFFDKIFLFVFFFSRRVQEVDKADTFNNLGKIKWELALCLFVVFIFVYFALWKGIKSSGKVNLYLTIIFTEILF